MASRRFNLSTIQVSAGILAALTGAIAASFLGVAGTLVGAAVGSLASTVGGEVYKHYLERTHERLRGAVDVRRQRTARGTVVGRVDPAVVPGGAPPRRPVGVERKVVAGEHRPRHDVLAHVAGTIERDT